MSLVSAIDSLDQAVAEGKFNGYGPRPIPHELDSYPEAVIKAYLDSDTSQKELVQCLSPTSFKVLTAYAERQANSAVRSKSEANLKHALVALALAAMESEDVRDVLVVMALPWHTAELLGLNAVAAFEQAAKYLPASGRDFLLEFSQRSPEDQTLECMGYVVSTDDGGFRYQRTW